MTVKVHEWIPDVRVVDGESVLDSATMRRIVEVTLETLAREEARQARADAEQRLTRGVSDELEALP